MACDSDAVCGAGVGGGGSGNDAVATADMVLVALVELEQTIRAKSRGNVDCLCASIWFHVNARVVLALGLNATGFRQLCDAIQLRSLRALVAGGDAFGVIAAQSLGEPATQMALNTFHLSGRANVGVRAGIPRLREIIGGCKAIQTPMNTLRLVDPATAEALVGRLPLLGVKDSVVRVEMRHKLDLFVVEGAAPDDALALAMHAYSISSVSNRPG